MLQRRERRKLDRRFNKAQQGGKVKSIKYEAGFLTAVGQPFSVLDPDARVQKEARDKAREDKKETYEMPTIDCDFAQAMTWFVNNIPFERELDKDGKQLPPRKLTPEDTGNAYAVIKAFSGELNGQVEMEDAVYKWLVELNKTDGIVAFRGVTQAVVAERLDNLVKEDKE